MAGRKKIPKQIQTDVLMACRRRCCLCFGVSGDAAEKKGQIAHLDHDPANNELENLAYLCFDHHDSYDSQSSQSKGLTIDEVKRYREELVRVMQNPPSDTGSNQPVAAAVYLGPNAINVSGPNAVHIAPRGVQIVGPVVQAGPPVPELNPDQARLLTLLADYMHRFDARKLVITRGDGTLHFDDEPEKKKDVSLVTDVFGSNAAKSVRAFEELMDSMPDAYVRRLPESRWDNPFVVTLTELGIARARA